MTREELMNRFMDFYDRIKGRKDVKSRVSVLLNPENLKTSSILSRGQAEFLAVAHWASGVEEWGGIFNGMRDYAKELSECSISVKGEGREQAIRFMGALSEGKILSKLGIGISGEPKEGKGKK